MMVEYSVIGEEIGGRYLRYVIRLAHKSISNSER